MENQKIIEKLSEMIAFEEKQPDKYKFGAALTHWRNPSDCIAIDLEAMKALLKYYEEKEQEVK